MKTVIELKRAITHRGYNNDQFLNSGECKNILYINPQLSGKNLYKMILPYFSMYNENINTAINTLHNYNKNHHLIEFGEYELSDKQIYWADFIVFPFTTIPLKETYEHIRSISPETKIAFNVDFDYYEIPDGHPYKEFFTKEAKNIVEDNIYNSDVCFVSNVFLQKLLLYVFEKLNESKYKENQRYLMIICLPLLCDPEVQLENIDDFTPEEANIIVPKKENITKLNVVANNLKKEDIKENHKKVNPNAKKAVKTTKTVVKATKSGKTIKKKVVEKPKANKTNKANKNNKFDELENPLNNIPIEGIPLEQQTDGLNINNNLKENQSAESFRIGIICNENDKQTLVEYRETFLKINQEFPNAELVFFGYNGLWGTEIFEGLSYEYIKPVSIVHYFKQLKALNLNLIFVPFINKRFYACSENFNKYFEGGFFKIPLLAPNLFPYKNVIIDKNNGFLYNDKDDVLTQLKEIVEKKESVKDFIGANAQKDVLSNYVYSEQNIKFLESLFNYDSIEMEGEGESGTIAN